MKSFLILVATLLFVASAPAAGLFHCEAENRYYVVNSCPTASKCLDQSQCTIATWTAGVCRLEFGRCNLKPAGPLGNSVWVTLKTQACSIRAGGTCDCQGGEETPAGGYWGDEDTCS